MIKAKECRRILPSGARCHALAVKGTPFCFFHQAQRAFDKENRDRYKSILVPRLEDRAGIHLALESVLEALGTGKMDPMRARAYFYGLQLAMQNLGKNNELIVRNSVSNPVCPEDGEFLAPDDEDEQLLCGGMSCEERPSQPPEELPSQPLEKLPSQPPEELPSQPPLREEIVCLESEPSANSHIAPPGTNALLCDSPLPLSFPNQPPTWVPQVPRIWGPGKPPLPTDQSMFHTPAQPHAVGAALVSPALQRGDPPAPQTSIPVGAPNSGEGFGPSHIASSEETPQLPEDQRKPASTVPIADPESFDISAAAEQPAPAPPIPAHLARYGAHSWDRLNRELTEEEFKKHKSIARAVRNLLLDLNRANPFRSAADRSRLREQTRAEFFTEYLSPKPEPRDCLTSKRYFAALLS